MVVYELQPDKSKSEVMKSILIATTIIGAAIGGLLFYFTNNNSSANKVMNIEDGMPIEAQ
jgi:hypothetical protein